MLQKWIARRVSSQSFPSSTNSRSIPGRRSRISRSCTSRPASPTRTCSSLTTRSATQRSRLSSEFISSSAQTASTRSCLRMHWTHGAPTSRAGLGRPNAGLEADTRLHVHPVGPSPPCVADSRTVLVPLFPQFSRGASQLKPSRALFEPRSRRARRGSATVAFQK
jgi:hypothetical protein